MRPIAETYGQIIDCTVLKLEARFYAFTQTQTEDLARDFYAEIQEYFSAECYIDWRFDNRKLKDIELPLKNRKNKSGCFDLSFEGAVKTSEVYNATSFRRSRQRMLHGNNPSLGHNCSADFPEYYKEHFGEINVENAKSVVIQINSEPRRRCLSYCTVPDIHGFMSVFCNDQHFYGVIDLGVMCYSLGDELNAVGEHMSKFISELSKKYVKLNASICLDPLEYQGVYFSYFGGYPRNFEMTPENTMLWSRARYFYVSSIGWFNIVSPKTREMIGVSPYSVDESVLLFDGLPNGALILKCNKSISETDIYEIRSVRAYLYNALLPGSFPFSINGMQSLPHMIPRARWELIPLFEDEIRINGDEFIISHTGKFNPSRVLRSEL